MQTRLLKHLKDYNILSCEQYGFRPGLNTDNATYQLTDEILHALNNKLKIGGIFCDLEKAFDCVNHKNHKNWEDIFMEGDANVSFNKFLNTYLRIFHSCFTKKHKNVNIIPKPWLTAGIKTSCKRKRELYLIARDSMGSEPKIYYKHYCKILTKVLKEAKKLYYKDIIDKSKNKIKTTWNIIHKETMNQPDDSNIKSLKINNYITQNQKSIAK